MRAQALGILVAGLLLSGCSSSEKPVQLSDLPQEPSIDPLGEPFADSRHCYAYDLHTMVLASDLILLVPSNWTLPNPVAAEVRVLLHRCIEDATAFVTVPMRAGLATELDAPMAEFVLEVFTDTKEDAWAVMGAPTNNATIAREALPGGEESWVLSTAEGMALRLDIAAKGSPGTATESVREYGAGPGVVRSWAKEGATLTRPTSGTIDFGPGSVLDEARAAPGGLPEALAPVTGNHWWGAFNAEYRLGRAP